MSAKSSLFTGMASLAAASLVTYAINSSAMPPSSHVGQEAAVVAFAAQAASIYSYNPKTSSDAQTQGYRHYFTPSSWKSYQQAIADSGTSRSVDRDHLNVQTRTTGQARIQSYSIRHGKAVWIVAQPVQTTVQSPMGRSSITPSIMTLGVIAPVTSTSKNNLRITQLIVSPMPTSE